MTILSQSVKVTVKGLILNAFLTALKLGVGFGVGSAVLVADGIHSLSDGATDVVALLGIKIAERPADAGHAYGHGRFETISASIIGAALLVAGIAIAWQSGRDLYRGEENVPGYPLLLVAVVSLVSKEWLYRVTRGVALSTGSPALQANAWHHRSDAFSSVAVLFGGIAAAAGWGYGDSTAAMVVAVIIIVVGFGAVRRAFVEVTEAAISEEESRVIVLAIGQVPGVRGWHRLRTRAVGPEVHMDVHVLVDPWLSVEESHEICSSVERSIEGSLSRPVTAVVHCEPYRGEPPDGNVPAP